MAHIQYIKGDIFNSQTQVIVNTVNCHGVMGKGLALSFKQRYPEMFAVYEHDCQTGKLKIGRPTIYQKSSPWILNFPTKNHWRHPSKLEYIEKGLTFLANNYKKAGITSIAFPKLGAQNGKLEWDDVGPVMAKYLSQFNIDVYIYIAEGDKEYQYDPLEDMRIHKSIWQNFSEIALSVGYSMSNQSYHHAPDNAGSRDTRMKPKNMTMNTITCPNCQKESREDVRFCGGCGQALPAQATPAEQKPEAIHISLLYSHEDEELKEHFLKHMAVLRRTERALVWHDGDIKGGEEIHKEVDAHMASAKIILMLISASFIASDYCYGEQMEVAMRRHKEGTAKVVPIIIKPVDWKGTPFDILQVVPHSGKPISTWNNRDEAWLEVVRAIKAILK